MNKPELKKLAEFSVSFLWKANYYMNYKGAEDKLFNNWKEAPILAHLAKREMEKRGFAYYHQHFQLHGWSFSKSTAMPIEPIMDENEYIALWSAIEATGEK